MQNLVPVNPKNIFCMFLTLPKYPYHLCPCLGREEVVKVSKSLNINIFWEGFPYTLSVTPPTHCLYEVELKR